MGTMPGTAASHTDWVGRSFALPGYKR